MAAVHYTVFVLSVVLAHVNAGCDLDLQHGKEFKRECRDCVKISDTCESLITYGIVSD
jgi:hypothetical protein